MIVAKRDQAVGETVLIVQDRDDMWHLSQVLCAGDHVRMFTARREEARPDELRAKRAEKKKMVLTVRLERVEFEEESGLLRLAGIIVEGPQDLGEHHSFGVEEGDSITVIKRWADWEWKRVEEAVSGKGKGRFIIIAIEDDNVVVAELFSYGLRERVSFSTSGGKMDGPGPDRPTMFREAAKAVASIEAASGILVVGPGFFKEDFLKYAREEAPDAFRSAASVQTGQGGMPGVREALTKGLAKGAIKDARMAADSEAVGGLMEAIAKGGVAAYGLAEVEKAASLGAIASLLVNDDLLRDAAIQRLMKRVEEKRGLVRVVTSKSDPGKQLAAIGGVGALLRFPIG